MRSAGFTLPELMAVVTIVGVMSSAAMFGMKGYGNGQGAASLARSIHFMMMRARAESAGDNTQRKITCSTSGCTYVAATTAGMSSGVAFPTVTASTAIDTIAAGTRATIWNVTASTEAATTAAASAAQMSTTASITFYPDGSATPATVYVADKNKGTGNQYKIYVYKATGMSRLVNNW